MDTDAYPRDDVKQFLGAMIVVKINPETNKDGKKVADQFGVNSFPRLIMLTPKGEKLREIKGSPQPDQFAVNFTNDLWNAMVTAQNAEPRDWKGMAKNIATLVLWYPQTDQGKNAAGLVDQLKGTPEFAAAYQAELTAHEIEALALKADAQLKLKKKNDAIETWKALLAGHPGTPEADEAAKQLKKLGVKLDAPADAPKK